MIEIPIPHLKAARKLLTRIRFDRLSLPVLTHILVTIDNAVLTLAVTDLDHWLETRIPATITGPQESRFLLPAPALAVLAKADRNSSARLECSGTPKQPQLRIITTSGGLPVENHYQPEPAAEYPERPKVTGRITAFPKATMQAIQTVAPCLSTDATRYVLNCVCLTPQEGGMAVATDGRRLAAAPARTVDRDLLLPTTAVHVLAHEDFTSRDAAIMVSDGENACHVQFRSSPHTFIARLIDGHYPSYQQVVPSYVPESATLQETHRAAVIRWLRSLKGNTSFVVLTWQTGQMTLTHEIDGTQGATLQVPVTLEGNPPTIAFPPKHLADAFQIGEKLNLTDNLNPGMTTSPSGAYCVVMNIRYAIETTQQATNPIAA